MLCWPRYSVALPGAVVRCCHLPSQWRWLSFIRSTFVRRPSDFRPTSVRRPSDVRPTFVRLPSDFRPTSVRLSFDFQRWTFVGFPLDVRPIIVRLPSNFRRTSVLRPALLTSLLASSYCVQPTSLLTSLLMSLLVSLYCRPASCLRRCWRHCWRHCTKVLRPTILRIASCCHTSCALPPWRPAYYYTTILCPTFCALWLCIVWCCVL
jgi:hypothetical protein